MARMAPSRKGEGDPHGSRSIMSKLVVVGLITARDRGQMVVNMAMVAITTVVVVVMVVVSMGMVQ